MSLSAEAIISTSLFIAMLSTTNLKILLTNKSRNKTRIKNLKNKNKGEFLLLNKQSENLGLSQTVI